MLWLSAEPVTRLLYPVAFRSTNTLLQGQEYMGVLQQGKHFSSHSMPPSSQGWPVSCSPGTSATKYDRPLQLVHFHGKEAASSALPGIAKLDRTAAKGFPFAMQNRSCILREGKQLIPTKPVVQSLSRSGMELE